jgi:hypothetical protein
MHAILITLAFLADPEPEPAVKFDATLGRGDKFEVKMEKGAPVWVISGGTGIGDATVKVKAGKAPKKVIVRFAGLKNLEMFKVSVNDVGGHVRLGGTSYFGPRGMATKDDATLTLTAREGKDCVEVEIVTKEATKEWVMGWINEYRRR